MAYGNNDMVMMKSDCSNVKMMMMMVAVVMVMMIMMMMIRITS